MLRALRMQAKVVLHVSFASVLLFASPVSASASASRPRLPSALVVLEQRMSALRVNTERGTIEMFLSGFRLGGGSSLFEVAEGERPRRKSNHDADRDVVLQLPLTPPPDIPLLTADFEASVSPRLVIVRAELLGGLSVQMRLIGERLYERSPFLGIVEEGKAWVYTSPSERAKEQASTKTAGAFPLPAIGEPEAGFHKLIAWLAKARSVVEVGPAVVDRQPTTEFSATLDVNQPLTALISGSSSATKMGRSLTRETLQLFLASNGLPVRAQVRAQEGKARMDATVDILATEVPVSVMPPPATETISQAELRQREGSGGGVLEAESHPLTKREREEARRLEACMNQRLREHGKRLSRRRFRKVAHECERRAKLPGRSHRKARPHSRSAGGGSK